MTSATNSNTPSVSLPDGRLLSYRLSVPGQGPNHDSSSAPVILLSNSLMAPFRTWDHFVAHLLSKDYRVLCYDQLGHGNSTINASTYETTTFSSLASDVRVLLDTLDIKQVFAWVGISMGAATGVYFTIANPGRVRNLVICDTISFSPIVGGIVDVFEPRVQLVKTEGESGLEKLIEGTLERWFSAKWRAERPDEVQRMKGIMRTTTKEGFVGCCQAIQSPEFDLRPIVGSLGGAGVDKVMVVVGELDANLPQTMGSLRDRIEEGFMAVGKPGKSVQFKVVKGSGHVCVIDGFDEYRDAVTSFLEG